MNKGPKYVLDADCLIRSKKQHYALDICPGFWDAILQSSANGVVTSIQPVREELLKGNDALAQWVKEKAPDRFFAEIDAEAVLREYGRVVEWVEFHEIYTKTAKRTFIAGADPMLIAFAAAKGCEVVTYEVPNPDSKVKVKLPDVARQFQVKCLPPYVMLRNLGVKLALQK